MLRRRAGVLSHESYSTCRAQLLLSAFYVFGCAFRSALPVFDVPRITLFNTWLSSVAVGRSVATIAEVCFVAQWALDAQAQRAANWRASRRASFVHRRAHDPDRRKLLVVLVLTTDNMDTS